MIADIKTKVFFHLARYLTHISEFAIFVPHVTLDCEADVATPGQAAALMRR